MLTGKLVRVRVAKTALLPQYIDVNHREWTEVAEELLALFRTLPGKTRAEMEEETAEVTGDLPSQLVHQGLAKLLEDRCQFEVDSEISPEEIREKAFLAAGEARVAKSFDRNAILGRVAREFNTTSAVIDSGLFADLKSEQRMIAFDDLTALQLLNRYNVALAQAVLLKATRLTVRIFDETPARYRTLLQKIKFHRLICEIERADGDVCTIHLDGPMSLFSSTQKYGISLANFLPSILHCKRYEVNARVRWGTQRVDGLRSHTADTGDAIAPELQFFAEAFRKKIADWDLNENPAIVPLKKGDGYWTPDFAITHPKTGRVVHVELLGFWRKASLETLLAKLKGQPNLPYVIGLSEQMNADEELAAEGDDHIYLYKRTPQPDEVVRRAERV
jgi:uncharacterized protein